MSKCINKVTLLGFLCDDPQVRYTPTDAPVTNISFATNVIKKIKSTNEVKVRTQWHKVVFFNRVAETAAQYLKKGSKVYIEGSLRTNIWQDNNGDGHLSTEIVC